MWTSAWQVGSLPAASQDFRAHRHNSSCSRFSVNAWKPKLFVGLRMLSPCSSFPIDPKRGPHSVGLLKVHVKFQPPLFFDPTSRKREILHRRSRLLKPDKNRDHASGPGQRSISSKVFFAASVFYVPGWLFVRSAPIIAAMI